MLVKPYDDERVICGQGTIGIELAEQIAEQDIKPARLYCCAGGGGLIAGTSVSLHETHPDLPSMRQSQLSLMILAGQLARA